MSTILTHVPAIDVLSQRCRSGEDPQTHLYLMGIELAEHFLRFNSFAVPDYRARKLNSTSLYDPRRCAVYVNLDACAKPVKRPGRMRWSHPGYKIDRTPFGVVLHETGHYVAHMLSDIRVDSCAVWRSILRIKGKRVSGYEPNPAEAFAESMRLFIGNPNLLRRGLPDRYEYLCEFMRPVVEMDAYVTVGNGDYYGAISKWIGDSNGR